MNLVIIGGGQSGLVTCKTFIENNFKVLLLEKGNKKNGLFSNVLEKEYFRWSSSRYISGFSDFPIPKNFPVWMNFKQYCQYLELYKKKNNLDKFIQYNSNVISVKKKDTKWEIIFVINKEERIIYSDFLIVTTGLNSYPKYPKLGDFKGEIIHTDTIYSKMNKNNWKDKFSNKNILLIGGGESALDIGNLLLNYSKELYYSTRSYIEWFPEWAYSKDFLNNNKLCHKKSITGLTIKTPSDTHLSYLEYSLPTPVSGFWHLFGRKLLLNFWKNSKINCVHNNKKLCDITETPENLFAKPVIKRTSFICDIHNNRVKVIYYPTKFLNNKIVSKDGIFNIDIIVTGSGYKVFIPFISEKYYNCELIKKMVPKIDPTIGFVGYVRPTMGSINNISEMQSWWLVDYFKGNLNYKIRNLKWGRPEDPLNIGRNIVIGNYYMKDLAMDLKIMPNLTYILITDPKLWVKIMHNTIHPSLFRIYGKMKIKNGKNKYYNTFPSLKEKSDFLIFYLMFIIFHIIFLLILFMILFLMYKYFNSKKTNYLRFLIIYIILIHIIYDSML